MSHSNARLTLLGRLLLCRRIEREGSCTREAATATGVRRQTATANKTASGTVTTTRSAAYVRRQRT
jgi:hypothetical protein